MGKKVKEVLTRKKIDVLVYLEDQATKQRVVLDSYEVFFPSEALAKAQQDFGGTIKALATKQWKIKMEVVDDQE